MPSSFNGTGTKYYGHALPLSDGSYVVTEWITLLWIPLIPLRSKRVWHVNYERRPWWDGRHITNFTVAPVPLYIPHLLKVYGTILFVVFADVLLIHLSI